jgi:biotin carboxyl carrier protein
VKTGPFYAYVDNVVFQVGGRVAGPTANLVFYGQRQPSRLIFSAAPKSDQIHVSNVCPVSVNEWKLSVSDKPVKYPDGTEYLELVAQDGGTGTKLTLPLANGALRRFGRFEVRVGDVWESTRAASLVVQAQPDRSIQGGDTYVDELTFDGNNAGEMLDRLGEKYGFKVEWVAAPGHPESVEYGKGLAEGQGSVGRVVVKEAMGRMFSTRFVLDWKSPTLLQVSVKDYDRVLAQKQKDAEAKERIQRAEQVYKDWEDRFQQEYSLVTRIYALKKMSAATARALIDSEMGTYYLSGPPSSESYRMSRTQAGAPPNALASATERCFADERTNSIIVSALPSTLEKVERIIREFDKAEAAGEPQGPASRYRIEVVLLQGGKAGEKIEEVARGTRLSFALAGQVRDLPVKAGMKMKAGDVIARLDPSEQELRLRKAESDLSSAAAQTRAVEDTYARTKKLVATGHAGQAEASQAEAALATTRAQYDAAQASLQSAKFQLSYCTLLAPSSGTITSVPVNANERVEAGQVVATLMPEAKAASEAGKGPGVFAPELAAQYGISPEDLKLFGFDAVAEMGKGLVTLSAEPGPTGRAVVSLSESYRCEIEFQDVRPPYVIVRGRLLSAQSDKPFLENTLFLEKGKPSVLGLTNLRQALILVLRLLDEPSGPGPVATQRRVLLPVPGAPGTPPSATRPPTLVLPEVPKER